MGKLRRHATGASNKNKMAYKGLLRSSLVPTHKSLLEKSAPPSGSFHPLYSSASAILKASSQKTTRSFLIVGQYQRARALKIFDNEGMKAIGEIFEFIGG